ncbi:Dcl-like protein [Thalictrum thalictroides]|uniref:Dcl-like protein n=1 Tax=Thalictrum thalictroides TaxID=46969 RepID=A0A7J6WV15_THATH|nr:Dcl-like protein [Thalictrum thalictroides]
MISIPNSTPPLFLNRINPNSLLPFTSPPSLIFFNKSSSSSKTLIRSLKTESDGDKVVKQDPFGPDLLKKPSISPLDVGESATTTKNERFSNERDYESEDNKRGEDDDWVDWEDQILEDTVPLVGFVRMLLHSGKYGSGDRLSPDHEKTILERLLPYHPDFERKIGCGVDYIKVDYHPDFADSRCLFIVRKDGESVDFSYWKCIKGLIKKNYPLYADSFILRHFRRRSSRNE